LNHASNALTTYTGAGTLNWWGTGQVASLSRFDLGTYGSAHTTSVTVSAIGGAVLFSFDGIIPTGNSASPGAERLAGQPPPPRLIGREISSASKCSLTQTI